MMRLLSRLCAIFALASPALAQTTRTPFSGSIREISATPHSAIARATLNTEETKATIDFEVVLKMRNFSDLQKRVGKRERIGRSEMADKYHPKGDDYTSVVAWLKAQGLTITMEDPSHLAVFGRGTVAQVSKAFEANFARVNFEGKEYTSAISAPTLPTTLAGVVLGVNGLQPQLSPHKHSRQVAPAANSTTGNGPPFLPSQIAKAYNGAGVSQTGAGQTIAIVIDTFPSNSDLTNFWTTCGVNQSLSNIQQVQVVSGTLPAPSGEETLDVEWSSSMAPNAKVRIYATLDLTYVHLDQAYAQIYNDLPSQPTLHQMSLSYGLGEAYTSTSQLQTDEQYFASLASGGVTIFVSSGDGGSNPTSSGGSGGATPTAESPSSSPSVIGVGGTSLTVDGTTGLETNETTWSGSGGGVSTYFSRPSWQTGNGLPSGTMRAVPDVAAPADPGTGALVILNGSNQQYGGTSWSAPTWAGICALINEARASAGVPALGLFGPKIYPLIGSASFRDITAGSNGAYSAGTGYDLCTGIGVPNIATLLQTLANAPTITTQPILQSVASGQTASFTVAAAGTAPFTYQWQRSPAGSSTWTNLTDNATYTGTQTTTLQVSSVTSAMSGDQFQCVVSNSYGTATSSAALLAVDVSAAPLIVTTLAGLPGTSGNVNGTGTAARFYYPGGIAFDLSGNIVVADTVNNTIRKVTPGGVVTTFAGSGAAGSSNGTGTAASFNGPSNVAVDSAGNIYVADASNSTIRKITTGAVVSTLAGRAGRTGTTDGTGSNARFNAPQGVTVDSNGIIYVADSSNNTIRKITVSGSTATVSTFAGSSSISGSADGTGTNARFNLPVDVATDSTGNVYVADTDNHTIRKITPAGVVTTLAGVAGVSGSNDGVAASAHFNLPSGVRLDSAGNVYVADFGNQTIRKITTAGVVVTLAGSVGLTGTADGIGSNARFNNPSDALPDASGHVYIVDTYNHALRASTFAAAPAIQTGPASVTVAPGQNATFSVTGTGNPAPTQQWQRLPAGGSTWSNLTDGGAYSGTATATLTVSGTTLAMNGDQFRCLLSNAMGSTTSGAATLSVGIAPQITSTSNTVFYVGTAGSFTFTASGTPTPTLSATGVPAWASFDANSGILSGTPPNLAGAPFTISITASNGIAPAASQNFTLKVQSTYASWQSARFGSNAGLTSISGPNADPNGNGVPNLLEYAFGGDPSTPGSTTPKPVVTLATDPSDGKLHLTLTATLDATAGGLTYTGEVSADLANWSTGVSNVKVVSDTTTGTVRTLILRDTTAIDTSGNRYIRLRVTGP